MKRRVRDLGLTLGIAMTALLAACSSDKNSTSSAALGALGKRGESCDSRADCETGLACVNKVCRPESLNLTPTGKSCVAVECTTAEDCCPTPPSSCPQYQMYCDEQPGSVYCDEYQAQCVCDMTKITCNGEKCVQTCTPSDGGIDSIDICQGSGRVCVGNTCAECAQDSDCTARGLTNRTCVGNACIIKCTKDTDCAAFYRCDTATSACVKSGCMTDRDCIVLTSNPLSACDQTTHDCQVPCQSDLECSGTSSSTSSTGGGGITGLQVCVDARCVDAGCENDDECRALLNVQPGTHVTAVCRAPTSP